jgi:hypothetical protein
MFELCDPGMEPIVLGAHLMLTCGRPSCDNVRYSSRWHNLFTSWPTGARVGTVEPVSEGASSVGGSHRWSGAVSTDDTLDDLVVPSAEVVAVVRHGAPGATIPDALVPYVVPVEVDGRLVDWYLTEDALAFADPHVVLTFADWRADWERSWTLDPRSSLERLLAAGTDLIPDACDASVVPKIPEVAGAASWIPAEAQSEVAGITARLRDAIRERDSEGFGFVDATPGRESVGLARTWSGQSGSEVLASDNVLLVTMQPETGLSISLRDDPSRSVQGVDEVELVDESVLVRSRERTLELDLVEARALAWLIPGSTRWRVRTVPEVVVWARTFAGVIESCGYASALHLPVQLTTLRPFGNNRPGT